VALGLAAAVVGSTGAHAARVGPQPLATAPPPRPTGSSGSSGSSGPNNHDNPETTPSLKPAVPTFTCGGCVTITGTPPPVQQTPAIPPPVVRTPAYTPPPPVYTPQQPTYAPPAPVQTEPVSVPPPPPVEIPPPPAQPAPAPAPLPAPVPGPRFTSSVDPGTQALTVILLFVVFGGWFYGNRIASQWSSGKIDDGRVTA
jgi:hypothetical protein